MRVKKYEENRPFLIGDGERGRAEQPLSDQSHSLVPSSGTIAQRRLGTAPLLYSAALAVKHCFVRLY